MNNFVSIYKNRKTNLLQQADLDEKGGKLLIKKIIKKFKTIYKNG